MSDLRNFLQDKLIARCKYCGEEISPKKAEEQGWIKNSEEWEHNHTKFWDGAKYILNPWCITKGLKRAVNPQRLKLLLDFKTLRKEWKADGEI